MVRTLVRTLAMVAATTTAGTARYPTVSSLNPKRLLCTSKITQLPSVPSLILGRRSLAPLSHAVRPGFTIFFC
ncbi:hypothetical protein M0R45_000141 [Rubus argutus]|uniref:Secreted protein n=1 Tax=Rubus argutus TaxID=59490 RepID=A0AAW1VMN5_RUBAR